MSGFADRFQWSLPTPARPGRFPAFGASCLRTALVARVPHPRSALRQELDAVTIEGCLAVLSDLAELFYATERAIDLPGERRALKQVAVLLSKAAAALEKLEAAKPNRAWSALLEGTRTQAMAARAAAETLPDGREAITLRRVAESFVLLRAALGLPRPALSDGGEAVRQVAAICDAAGLHLSVERIRGAISQACKLADSGDALSGSAQMVMLIRMLAAARRWPAGVAAAELAAEGLTNRDSPEG